MTGIYTMRAPCAGCGSLSGKLVPVGFQDTVRCLNCDRFQYNAPRSETGKPQMRVKTREEIKPSVRALVLVRACKTCELCGVRDEPLDVAHLLSVDSGRKEGLTDEQLNSEENLAAMCAPCNSGLSKLPVPLWLAIAIVKARWRITKKVDL